MTYLNGTKEFVLTLGADGMNILKWFVDASYATHIISKSTKQKLNTKSSTEEELVGADDIIPDILLTGCFLKAQGYESFQNVVA